jgi:hypothetical protein
MKPIQTRTVEVTKTETLTIGLDMATVAAWFCELDDEAQADFFVEVAKRAESWAVNPDGQWMRVGSHLRTCDCSTDEARELIRNLHYGLENA